MASEASPRTTVSSGSDLSSARDLSPLNVTPGSRFSSAGSEYSAPGTEGGADSATGVLPPSVADWSVDDVLVWLASPPLGLRSYGDSFARHKIDGVALLDLTQQDLLHHLGVSVLGHVKRIMHQIAQLQQREARMSHDKARGGALLAVRANRARALSLETGTPPPVTPIGSMSSAISVGSMDWCSEDMPEWSFGLLTRALFGACYFGFSIMCTSIVMVFVHERVPDQHKHPPLPDLFLDNIPRIPVAFALTELIGVVLFVMLCIVVVLHKHRLIILRRGLSIAGSIFLLRCVTMVATSLSVPSNHLRCQAGSFGDTLEEKMERAWEIGSRFGMTINGVETCGDYLFSGHSVAVTLLNFLLTEYTPFKGLHIFTWVLNLFGLFFVLAAHEHYSVDVLVAFYISSRMFMYYHSLANLNALSDVNTPSWYPMFSYLEENVSCVVPNELGWPWSRVQGWLDERRRKMLKHRRRRRPKNKMEAALAALRHENRRLRRQHGGSGPGSGTDDASSGDLPPRAPQKSTTRSASEPGARWAGSAGGSRSLSASGLRRRGGMEAVTELHAGEDASSALFAAASGKVQDPDDSSSGPDTGAEK